VLIDVDAAPTPAAIGKIMLCGTDNIVEMFLDEAVEKKKAKIVSYPCN